MTIISVLFLDLNSTENVLANPDEYIHEEHFRIGMDTPLTDMEWHDVTDAKTAGIHRDENFRVRFQLYNDGDGSKNWLPQLEYLETGSSWTEVPDTSGSLPFFIASTAQFVHGDNISTSYFALGAGTGTAQEGRAYCATPSDNMSLEAFSYTEIEFNVQANDNADYYIPYSFRVTDNGAVFDSYNNNAIISLWQDDNPDSPHYGYSNITSKCASCHRSHMGSGRSLRSSWPEEALCFTCHDGTSARTNIAAQFNVKSYFHPVSATEGDHTTSEGSYNWLPISNRHVECEDCHSPHGSRTGASTPGFGDLSRTIEKVWGVTVSNPTTGWTALTSGDYSKTSAITAEYQLCLKCHSSYAYDTAPPLSHIGGVIETDQAIEFNVNNVSYHWVETDKTAASGYTPRTNTSSRDMTFTAGSGMDRASPLGCSNCHASDTAAEPRGVHGSNNAYFLRGSWSETVTGTSYTLCFQCHDEDVYGPGGSLTADLTNFSGFGRRFGNTEPRPNLHAYHFDRAGVYGCQNCHSAVPHGGWNRAMLVELDDPAPYSNGSRLKIDSWDPGGGWIWADCFSSPCHIS